MKVWLVEDLDHMEVDVYGYDTNVLDIPFVSTEMGYLESGYADELEEFVRSIQRAKERGRGEATIEERVRVTLVEVK